MSPKNKQNLDAAILKIKDKAETSNTSRDFLKQIPDIFLTHLYDKFSAAWIDEDVLQEVILKLHRIFKNFDPKRDEKFSAYDNFMKLFKKIIKNRTNWQERWDYISLDNFAF